MFHQPFLGIEIFFYAIPGTHWLPSVTKPRRASRPPSQQPASASLSKHKRCWRNDEKTGRAFWSPSGQESPTRKSSFTWPSSIFPDCFANYANKLLAEGAFHELYE